MCGESDSGHLVFKHPILRGASKNMHRRIYERGMETPVNRKVKSTSEYKKISLEETQSFLEASIYGLS